MAPYFLFPLKIHPQLHDSREVMCLYSLTPHQTRDPAKHHSHFKKTITEAKKQGKQPLGFSFCVWLVQSEMLFLYREQNVVVLFLL